MQKVKIGFVGVGNMGQCAHLRNYASLPECEVVALAEIRPNLAQQVAARYGVPRVYKNHEELLAKEKLDGIVASQPFTHHGQIVPELLKAGVPVFTEKPIASSLPMGERVIEAAKKNKTWVMVGYHKRSDPATIHAKGEIESLKKSGALGKMKYVRITMPPGDWIGGGFNELIQSGEVPPKVNADARPADMNDEEFKRYIGFVNYYIHQVNLMRHLMGEPYRVTWSDPRGILLATESASGVVGLLEMSPYQTSVDWQETALITFERGYIKLNLPAPVALNRAGSVEIYRDPGNGAMPESLSPQLPWVHAMRQQATNFVRAIRGEAKPPCDATEALEDLKVASEYFRLLKK